jgi:pentatricopeptide repeat domain-containing protein 1
MPLRYAVEPVELSYRLAIIACNQAEHRERKNGAPIGSGFKWWECALSLLRRMKEDGVKPSLQTISSVVSSCEAAGEWQRAIGVLKSMPPFSSLLGRESMQEDDSHERPNLYCLNAAISACEKGGAWLEALQLYENILSIQNTNNSVRPNFVTVNSLLIALENAHQHDLSGSIYRDAVREKIVSPWKYRHDTDGKLRKMMVSST